jgi:hypothetical protein
MVVVFNRLREGYHWVRVFCLRPDSPANQPRYSGPVRQKAYKLLQHTPFRKFKTGFFAIFQSIFLGAALEVDVSRIILWAVFSTWAEHLRP